MAEDRIYGINPIREALLAGRDMDKLYVCRRSPAIGQLIGLAKEAGTPVIQVEEPRLEQMIGERVNHQGVFGTITSIEYVQLDQILELAREREEQALVLLLDGVEDPQNLGAIARSAEALGAHGLIVPKRRSAAVGSAAMRASSGALNHIAVARVTNLTQTAEELKKAGLWIVGADMGEQDAYTANLSGPIALCLGGEGKGLSKGLLDHCDIKVGIPLLGRMNSLNVAAAGGILLYEILRQRGLG